MKKIVLVITLVFCSFSLRAQDQQLQTTFPEKISAIDQEINKLQQQKLELQREIKSEYHEEMEHEMQSQKDLIEYDWSGVSSSLKQAETAEQKARLNTIKMHALEKELEKLTREKELLLQTHKGS